MTTRVLRAAESGFWLPRFAAVPGLMLSLAASAAFAAPPGVLLSNLELAASAIAERSSQVETAGGGEDLVVAVSNAVRATADAGADRSSAPADGEADAGDGDSTKSRRHGLEDLVVEFLEKL